MGEIIFDKSRKNLKKIQNKIQNKNLNTYVRANKEETLFLAIGGYNRTYELLLAMGVKANEIVTFSNLNLTTNFLIETHNKKILYIKKINYVTSVKYGQDYTKRHLDLNVADGFEESMMIYRDAERKISVGKGKELVSWQKPSIVILDDQSLNLQTGGHRFYYQTIGFVQMRNRNADPHTILKEIENVEEAEELMFALYQQKEVDESEVLNALNRLSNDVTRKVGEDWYLKPTEFKRVVGSSELVKRMLEMAELGIQKLSSNKKIGKENARWVIVPNAAFEFKGFEYKDELELFEDELEQEEQTEQAYALEQERRLNEILSIEFPLNMQLGYASNQLAHNPATTLQTFIEEVDAIEQEKVEAITLLTDATTEEEYKFIKKRQLAYFLDGSFKDDKRLDDNYQGGKRLISIDIDEGNHTRQNIEQKLESQGLFGLIYPTAKYYFDQSKRWRIILMADEAMTKESYKHTVEGVGKMLGIEIDAASKKISQLMGYPMAQKDVSIVVGTAVSVAQFKPKEKPLTRTQNVIEGNFTSNKTLLEFNHPQARLLKETLEHGAAVGTRNETYRQLYLFLMDTLESDAFEHWHAEAYEYLTKINVQAKLDGLHDKELEVIFR